MGEVDRNRFSKSWNQSDVIFVVEGEEFHGHYKILSSISTVFSEMFNHGDLDVMGKRIELPGKDRTSFFMLLNYIYPSSVRNKLTKGTADMHTLAYTQIHINIHIRVRARCPCLVSVTGVCLVSVAGYMAGVCAWYL